MPLSSLITEFLEHLEIEKGRSPLTTKNYDRYLRTFLAWAAAQTGKEQLHTSDLTAQLVRQFRIHLNRQTNNRGEYLQTSTQNYYLIALRSLLKYMQKNDIACLAPEKIELAKQTRPQVSVLSLDKLDLMLKSAQPKGPDDKNGLRDTAMLETFFSTGLRVSELASLDRNRINTKTREFVVRGKGSKDRVVFLSKSAAHSIENYLKKRNDSYSPLFIRHRGAPQTNDKKGESMRLSPRSIQRNIHKYARQAGIVEKITPHTLRHTFATDLLQSGADLRSVQEMLGHSNIQTTQVYTHVTNKQLREVHEAFHARRRKTK